jgi:hypothetical protein
MVIDKPVKLVIDCPALPADLEPTACQSASMLDLIGAAGPDQARGYLRHDYSRAERRGRDSSCTSGLQFWARHAITAEAVAKAPTPAKHCFVRKLAEHNSFSLLNACGSKRTRRRRRKLRQFEQTDRK